MIHIKSKQDKKQKKCLYCNKEIFNSKKKYCCIKCQKDNQYKQYIKAWKMGEKSGAKNGIRVSGHVRRYLFELNNHSCSRCGWDTPNPTIGKVILEIEHIDGDCTNNKPENLDLICPNCHSLTSTYKALNYGNGNKNRLKYSKLI